MSGQDGFPQFPKIPRLHRDVVITEKIDGINALVSIEKVGADSPAPLQAFAFCPVAQPSGEVDIFAISAGSRTRWLTLQEDNFGFAQWVNDHARELAQLGPGLHYGEWWGSGIRRGYGLAERRFSLFNTARWRNNENTPNCVSVVPVLAVATGSQLNDHVTGALYYLQTYGSLASPGFPRPEGVVIYHTAGRHAFKVLMENDNRAKGQAA